MLSHSPLITITLAENVRFNQKTDKKNAPQKAHFYYTKTLSKNKIHPHHFE